MPFDLSGRDVDVELHLRMDAAEHQERAGFREVDLDGFARLLRAGIEVELGIEDANIVGARVVVDDPEPVAAAERDMRRGETSCRPGTPCSPAPPARRAAFRGDDLLRQGGLVARSVKRAKESDEVGAFGVRPSQRAQVFDSVGRSTMPSS